MTRPRAPRQPSKRAPKRSARATPAVDARAVSIFDLLDATLAGAAGDFVAAMPLDPSIRFNPPDQLRRDSLTWLQRARRRLINWLGRA